MTCRPRTFSRPIHKPGVLGNDPLCLLVFATVLQAARDVQLHQDEEARAWLLDVGFAWLDMLGIAGDRCRWEAWVMTGCSGRLQLAN